MELGSGSAGLSWEFGTCEEEALRISKNELT
jgi:hypothetical protein